MRASALTSSGPLGAGGMGDVYRARDSRLGRDGSELFYIALDGRLMAVPVRASADGAALTFGPPTPLFAPHVGGALQRASLPLYTPSSDGKTFLMLTVRDDSFSSPLTVLLNWKAKP